MVTGGEALKGGQHWNQKNKKLWLMGACHCKQPVHLYRNNYALCPIKARQIKPGANPEPPVVVRPCRRLAATILIPKLRPSIRPRNKNHRHFDNYFCGPL